MRLLLSHLKNLLHSVLRPGILEGILPPPPTPPTITEATGGFLVTMASCVTVRFLG